MPLYKTVYWRERHILDPEPVTKWDYTAEYANDVEAVKAAASFAAPGWDVEDVLRIDYVPVSITP